MSNIKMTDDQLDQYKQDLYDSKYMIENDPNRQFDEAKVIATFEHFITTIESQQEKLDLLTEPPSEIIEFLTEGLAQKDALIESQKEEIKLKNGMIDGMTQVIEDKSPYAAQKYWEWLLGKGKDDLENEIESLKAITELAVKENDALKVIIFKLNPNEEFPLTLDEQIISTEIWDGPLP